MGNRNPTWNQSFQFVDSDTDSGQGKLICQVFDWNRVMAHKFIAEVEVHFKDIVLEPNGFSKEHWYELWHADRTTGPTHHQGSLLLQFSQPVSARDMDASVSTPAPGSLNSTSNAQRPLPPGWKEYWSKSKQRPYFKNKVSGDSVWVIPDSAYK
mmetsp:Transcript_3705/g.5867  ORF Transcript_3705/g.5867 Transcript_3705/m.5867 type:complete len:154 (+) Transcript_3705:458-919(+)